MKNLLLLALLAGAVSARAQDVVHLKNGTTREGRVAGLDANFLRLAIASPVPGQPAATTTINRADVAKLVFGPDAALDAIEKNPGPGNLPSARARWQALEPFLAVPESRAGQAGCLLGETLLATKERARAEEALALFRRLETGAWNPEDRARATRGRIESMLATGQLQEASLEAAEIARQAEDPDLLIRVRLLQAKTRLAALAQLLDENPRWYEDPPVKVERDKLMHEGLDLALYPFLFHGGSADEAAEGLWIAHEIHDLSGDGALSAAVCGDLVEIYPGTPQAKRAAELLAAKAKKPANP